MTEHAKNLTSTPRRRPAFTIIELMIVVVVIGLLITMVVGVGSTVVDSQRRIYTQQILANTETAVRFFETEAPLRNVYNRRDGQTWGNLPPYPVHHALSGAPDDDELQEYVCYVMEPGGAPGYEDSGTRWGNADAENNLSVRLTHDMGSSNAENNTEDWVRFGWDGGEQRNQNDGNDDIRALYAYLDIFTPRALNAVPKGALKPLNPQARLSKDEEFHDYVNPGGRDIKGRLPDPGDPDPDTGFTPWREVFGIHDAWGVPLDYYIYAKVEWAVDTDGEARYIVTDRIPVLRSRGITREQYDAWREIVIDDPDAADALYNRTESWIVSSAMPRPVADVVLNSDDQSFEGKLRNEDPPQRVNGWSRVIEKPMSDKDGNTASRALFPYVDTGEARK